MLIRRKQQRSLDHLAKPQPRRRRVWKWTFGIIALIIISIVAWYGTTIYTAIQNATTNHIGVGSSLLNPNSSQAASNLTNNGRINILLIGIGGPGHDGPYLADSIEVMSIDTKNHVVDLLSVPRDLYVPIPGYGHDKINSADVYGEQNSSQPGGGAVLLKKVVSNVLGVPIQYYIRMDFSGFSQMINTVGGITVDVKTPLYDPYYPKGETTGYTVVNIPAGVHNFDGTTALEYARSRETTTDFARSGRQQQIIKAFEQKALSLGVLANPVKVTSLISTLGKHVLTDLSPSEMQQLLVIGKDSFGSGGQIISKVMDNSATGVLKDSTGPGGAYILLPKAGKDNFTAIQAMAQQFFADPFITQENASIDIENASGTPGLAADTQKYLESLGYTVASVTSADATTNPSFVYDRSNGKASETTKRLSQELGIAATHDPLPVPTGAVAPTADIVIVLGPDFSLPSPSPTPVATN